MMRGEIILFFSKEKPDSSGLFFKHMPNVPDFLTEKAG